MANEPELEEPEFEIEDLRSTWPLNTLAFNCTAFPNTPNARFVLILLAHMASNDDNPKFPRNPKWKGQYKGWCYADQEFLARRVALRPETFSMYAHMLEKAGLIEIRSYHDKLKRMHLEYKVIRKALLRLQWDSDYVRPDSPRGLLKTGEKKILKVKRVPEKGKKPLQPEEEKPSEQMPSAGVAKGYPKGSKRVAEGTQQRTSVGGSRRDLLAPTDHICKTQQITSGVGLFSSGIKVQTGIASCSAATSTDVDKIQEQDQNQEQQQPQPQPQSSGGKPVRQSLSPNSPSIPPTPRRAPSRAGRAQAQAQLNKLADAQREYKSARDAALEAKLEWIDAKEKSKGENTPELTQAEFLYQDMQKWEQEALSSLQKLEGSQAALAAPVIS